MEQSPVHASSHPSTLSHPKCRCKRNEVPLERIFNRSLYQKFAWAMDIEPEYKF